MAHDQTATAHARDSDVWAGAGPPDAGLQATDAQRHLPGAAGRLADPCMVSD